MRLLSWLLLALCLGLVQASRLTAWPVAPDLPLALAAWAVTCGDARAWMLRVWLVGALRDLTDPGSTWFYAASHLVLIAACVPLQRWLPAQPWLALASVGAGMSLVVQAIDIVIGGLGGWTWWSGGVDAGLTALAAVAFGWLGPAPAKRTGAVEPAEDALSPGDQPAG